MPLQPELKGAHLLLYKDAFPGLRLLASDFTWLDHGGLIRELMYGITIHQFHSFIHCCFLLPLPLRCGPFSLAINPPS